MGVDPESILYRTLWLFAATFVAVALTFGLVIWWVVRRGDPRKRPAGEGPSPNVQQL